MKNYWWMIWLILYVSSCSTSSEEAFRARGQKIVKEMVEILEEVENHEELQIATVALKKQFKKLATLLVEVRAFRKKHPDYPWQKATLPGSEALFAQLARLYEIPGCREIIERSQGDAVYLLLRES